MQMTFVGITERAARETSPHDVLLDVNRGRQLRVAWPGFHYSVALWRAQ